MDAKYLSSNETTNFARLCRLVGDVCCDLLRAVLRAKVPSPGLTALLGSQKHHLTRCLDKRQRKILYPTGGSFVGTEEDLDFTLLYSLLRNIQSIDIPSHQKGWGNLPNTADRSLSANIDRLRIQRNEACAHLPSASISDSDFKKRLDVIRQSVLEIEKDVLTGHTYVFAVNGLLTMPMDPEREKYYQEKLEKQYKAEQEVKADVHEIRRIVADVESKQKSMKQEMDFVRASQEDMADDIRGFSSRQDVTEENISNITARQETTISDINNLKASQEDMAEDIKDVSSRQEVTDENISNITARQETTISDINNLKEKVTVIEDNMSVTSANTSQIKDLHPDLKPMIETAKAKIRKEREEKKFYPTKGFLDAKNKLLKNRVVVIKGNTGDGKTAIAMQILHWLCLERPAGQPLQIHKLEKLDLLSPNQNVIAFIDDIFGEKDVCNKDVQEWNKRISNVKTIFVDEQTEANFLVITVRNEVFNTLKQTSLGTIFTENNIIDLSSPTYKDPEEKKALLELYRPEQISWSEEEKQKNLSSASNVGTAISLVYRWNASDTQKCLLNEIMVNLNAVAKLDLLKRACDSDREKCALYLLSQGVQPNKHTDLWSLVCRHQNDGYKQICLLQKMCVYLNDETKLGLLNKACSSSTEECVLYLLSEGVQPNKDTDLWSLVDKHWNDCTRQICLLKKICVYLNDETKLAVLNEACFSHAEECVLYLLTEGVQPNNDTDLLSLVSRHRNDGNRQICLLQKICLYLNDETKLAVFNKACSVGEVQCVLYLLSEGVKPNRDIGLLVVSSFFLLNGSCWSRLFRNGWHQRAVNVNSQLELLKKIVEYLDDETKLRVLNSVCVNGKEECALYLLSKGVKPDKNAVMSLVTKRWSDGRKQLDLLKICIVNLNDETKLDLLNKACSSGAKECATYLLSEGVKPDKDTKLWSLVRRQWNDRQVYLLKNIFLYLNEETKLYLLNKACSDGAEECAIYLLSEGVQPDKSTAISLVSRRWHAPKKQEYLLKKITVSLNNNTRLVLLNKACSSGAVECAIYLLSEGVKPDKDTDLWSLISRHLNDPHTQGDLIKIALYVDDERKLDVLNKACESGADVCALYLLSEGVKPDKSTAMALVRRCWHDPKRQVDLLKKIVVYMNDDTKLKVLNKACSSGAEECALSLLSEGVQPDKETLFCVLEGGSLKIVRELLQYFVTSSPKNDNNDYFTCRATLWNRNKVKCLMKDSQVQFLDLTTDEYCDNSQLHVVLEIVNCSMFQTVERGILNSLCRVENEQTKCERVDGRLIHRNCACAQFMSQLVDITGKTVLHHCCEMGKMEICSYLCHSYPVLTQAVDEDGWHCLHYIAGYTTDLDMFIECETHVKQYLEATGNKYDITTIVDNKDADSVLDKARKYSTFMGKENNPLLEHLVSVFNY